MFVPLREALQLSLQTGSNVRIAPHLSFGMLHGLSSCRALLTFKPRLNPALSVGLNLSLYRGSFCSWTEMAHSPGYTDLSVSYHCVTNDLTIQGTWEEGVISLIGLRGVWTVLLQAESLKATWGSHFYQGRLFSWWRQKCRRVGQKEMRGKLRMGVITSCLFCWPNPASGEQGNSLPLVRGISETIAKVCEHQVGVGDTVYHRQYGCWRPSGLTYYSIWPFMGMLDSLHFSPPHSCSIILPAVPLEADLPAAF